MLRAFGRVMAVALALLMVTTMAVPALALPTSGTITAGNGQIAADGASVTQESAKLIIEWTDFSIGANETMTFHQPNSSAMALNRVIGGNPSEIMGALEANGQVFLVNPQGIVFGQDATVDVAGLVASTLALSDSDFLVENYVFTHGSAAGTVQNRGIIMAAEGGYVALLGAHVVNENMGTISAPRGVTGLGAGDEIFLDFDGDGLQMLRVDKAAVDALVENYGLVSADGGLAVLSVAAKDTAFASVLNQDGVVRASAVGVTGRGIYLEGGIEGSVSMGGTLETTDGIEIRGGDIAIKGDASVKAARVSLDATRNIEVNRTISGGSNINLQAGDSITINAPIAATANPAFGWNVNVQAPTIAINSSITGDSGGPHSSISIGNNPDRPTTATFRSITSSPEAQLAADFIWLHGRDGTIDLKGPIHSNEVLFEFGGTPTEITLSNANNFVNTTGTPSIYLYGHDGDPVTVSGHVHLVGGRDIELRGDVTAGSITVESNGNLILENIWSGSNPVLSIFRSEGPIVLASLGDGVFVNNAGRYVLQGDGRKIIYTSSLEDGYNLGGLDYGVADADAYPDDPVAGRNSIVYLVRPQLTITADSILDWIYSKTLPTFTASYSLSGHDVSSVQFLLEGGDGINVGTYTIVPYGANSSRYALKYVPGTLKVNPRPLTLVADDVNQTFGLTKLDLTYSVTGLATGDRADDVLGKIQLNVSHLWREEVGEYTIRFSGDEESLDANYYIKERRSGTLTIEKRPLMIIVNDRRWTYPYEPLVDFYGQWINAGPPLNSRDDEIIIWNRVIPRLSYILPETMQPGTYPLLITANHESLERNFVITYTPGTLIIEPPPPPPPPITWVQPIEVRVAGHTAEAWDVVRTAIDGFVRTGGRAMGVTHDQMFQALKNGDKQAAAQILPHLVAELGSILQTDESNLSAAQRAFLEPFKHHVQAERVAAAEKQLNDFYAEKSAGRHITDYGRFVGLFGVGRISAEDPMIVIAQLESNLKLQLANARKPVTFGDLQAMWGTEAGGQLVQLLLTQLGL